MISRDEARALAMANIRANWSVRDDEPWLNDGATMDEDSMWVFFYTSKRYHDTKNFLYKLAGNGPVVVDKKSGAVTRLGTSGGVQHQLAEFYRKQKMPNQSSQPLRASGPLG